MDKKNILHCKQDTVPRGKCSDDERAQRRESSGTETIHYRDTQEPVERFWFPQETIASNIAHISIQLIKTPK